MSCDKEISQTFQDNEYILFAPSEFTVQTRSTFFDSFPNESFGVLGYCVPYTQGSDNAIDWAGGQYLWNVKRPNVHADVFYKQEVTFDGTSCTYNYDNQGLRKWYTEQDISGVENVNPDDFYYTFFAYYPYNNYFSFKPESKDAKGAPQMTFTMPFSESDESSELNDDLTPDAMIARVANVQRNGGRISFNFYHVLTGLGFSVVNYNQTQPVILKSVKLQGSFTKSVTVDFSGPEMSLSYSGEYSGFYDIFTGSQEVAAANGAINLLGDRYLLLISGSPYESTYFGSDISLIIQYEYDGQEKTATLARPGSFMPQAGTRYTAQISFVGESFTLSFLSDTNWENGGDSDITIQ